MPLPQLPAFMPDPDDADSLDDSMLSDVKTFRMERMDDRCYWIGLYKHDGEVIHIDVFMEGRTMKAKVRK